MQQMHDLHAGLILKTLFSIASADRRWAKEERRLAQITIEHIWNQKLDGPELRQATLRLSEHATTLTWFSLIRPFAAIAPLRDHVASLETIVMRIANLVAKIDGQFCDSEREALESIRSELEHHLRSLALDDVVATSTMDPVTGDVRGTSPSTTPLPPADSQHGQPSLPPTDHPNDPPETLDTLLGTLNSLIGLSNIKQEVTTLTNLLQLQRERQTRGLPPTVISLHTVFTGNPGTGKTTVARLLARIFHAMGLLRSGHLVETDRSGLVAEYAGQTAPKTHERIDQALDGVLFIDEAYSLMGSADDVFGAEAIQTLLKRMEDDRDRFVVILAGYPEPLDQLLATNPGLSSRFSRRLNFEDYQTVELATIFQQLCETNHYTMGSDVRAKLLVALDWMSQHRDRHFGNGRTVRNLFESAVRRLANRIAGHQELTHRLLTRFEADDLQFDSVPADHLELRLPTALFRTQCPSCERSFTVPSSFLGRRAECNCGHAFAIPWGEPAWTD